MPHARHRGRLRAREALPRRGSRCARAPCPTPTSTPRAGPTPTPPPRAAPRPALSPPLLGTTDAAHRARRRSPADRPRRLPPAPASTPAARSSGHQARRRRLQPPPRRCHCRRGCSPAARTPHAPRRGRCRARAARSTPARAAPRPAPSPLRTPRTRTPPPPCVETRRIDTATAASVGLAAGAPRQIRPWGARIRPPAPRIRRAVGAPRLGAG
ncbi:hypothetical protein PVAP13_7NG273896 [Panicum virgatum]|uniref:Uncharacterized protein n=1 Tax=Panicum virgatum TaxID=38727 RepID=A0A8T0Q3F6_PANVG|nr:hypothetical protein PVAP13_7NG273896 [Panicum virgatum]